jgi:hypothetical protein
VYGEACEHKGVFLECSSAKHPKVLRFLNHCLDEGCVVYRSARNLSRRGVLVGHGVYSVLVSGNALCANVAGLLLWGALLVTQPAVHIPVNDRTAACRDHVGLPNCISVYRITKLLPFSSVIRPAPLLTSKSTADIVCEITLQIAQSIYQ